MQVLAFDQHLTKRLMCRWKRKGADVAHYCFSGKLKMEHDIIHPLHPYEQTEIVYAQILKMLDQT